MAELNAGIIETIKKVVKEELEEQCKLKSKDERTAFQKTESLLYIYPNLERVIANKKLEIEEVLQTGAPGKDKSIVEYSEHGGTVSGLVLPEDTVQAIVDTVQGQIAEIERAKATIDKALEHIKTDKYYPIIECRYFKGMMIEQIVEELNISNKTVILYKNRLVRSLSTWLFPQDVVNEILA